MSLEEYHALQRANAEKNQAVRIAVAQHRRTISVRRHLERAVELLDRETNRAACEEIEAALRKLD